MIAIVYKTKIGVADVIVKIKKLDIDKKVYKISPEDGQLYSFRANFTFWLEGNTVNARKIIKGSKEMISDFDYYSFSLIVFS